MILETRLPEAAYRVLEGATGLKNVYLKQMDIFSDPKRVAGGEAGVDQAATTASRPTAWSPSVTICAGEARQPHHLPHDGQRGPMGRWTRFSGWPWTKADPRRPSRCCAADAAIAGGPSSTAAQIHDPGVAEPLQRRAGHRNRQPQLPQKILASGFRPPTAEKGKAWPTNPRNTTFNKNAYKKALKDKLKLGFINNWRY